MAFPKVKLSDDSGNAVGVTDNRLNVNAYLAATPTIDIGDVSIKSGDGTAITDTVSGRLDVTLDSNSGIYSDDDDWTDGSSKHLLVGGLYQSSLQTVTDGDVAPFSISSRGELRVEIVTGSLFQSYQSSISSSLQVIDDWDATQNTTVPADGVMVMGEYKRIDGSTLPNTAVEGRSVRFATSPAGIQYAHLTDVGGQKSAIEIDGDEQQATPSVVNVGGEYRASPTSYTDGDATILQTNINGALNIVGTVDLGSTDNAVLDAMVTDLAAMEALLITIDADTNTIQGAVGADGSTGPSKVMSIGGTVAIGGNIQEIAVDANGHLQVDVLTAPSIAVTNAGTFAVQSTLQASTNTIEIVGDVAENANAAGNPVLIGGRYDSSARTLDNTDVGALAVNASGHLLIDVVDGGVLESAVDALEVTIGTLDSIKTAVETLDDAVHIDDAGFTLGTHKGMMMMGFAGTQSVDANDAAALACTTDGQLKVSIGHTSTTLVNASDATLGSSSYSETNTTGTVIGVVRRDALTTLVGTNNEISSLEVNANGALYTTHGITGGADDVKTVSNAGTDEALGGDVACKKIDIQAQTDNTGLIAVGFTGVDATEATGTGVILYAGDTYSLEMVNLNLIYIDSTVSGEGVRYTYFT